MFNNGNVTHPKLFKAVDKINKELGQHKLKLASQDPGRKWKMKQEKLSPRYSTRLREIIRVV